MPYPTPPPAPDSPIADLRGYMVEEVAIPILNAAGHEGMSGEFANAYRQYNRSTVTMSEVADSNIERLSNTVQDYVQGTRDYVNAITSDYMTKSQMESLRNKIDDLKAYLASPSDGALAMPTESSTWGIESVNETVSNSEDVVSGARRVDRGLEDVAEMERIYTYRLRERDRLQDDYYALIERLETRLDKDIVTNREASEGTPRGSILRAASAGDGVTGRFQESDFAVLPSDIGGLPTIRGTDASYADVSSGKADPNRGTGNEDDADAAPREDETEEEQAAPPTQTSPPTGTPDNRGAQSPGGVPSAPSGNRGSSPSAGPSRTPSSSSGERNSTSSGTETSNSSTGTAGPSADQIVNDLQNASTPEQVQVPAPNTVTSPGYMPYMPYMPPAMGSMNPMGGMPSVTPGSGVTGSQNMAPGSTLTGQQFNDLLDSIPQQARDTISQHIPQRPADVSSGINDAINRTRDAATQVSNAAGLNPATNSGLSNPSSAGTAGSGATAGSPKLMGAQPMAGAPGNAVGGRGGMGMPMMPPPMMGAPGGGGGGGRGNDGRKIVSNDPDMLGKDIKSTDPVVNARQRIADNEANK